MALRELASAVPRPITMLCASSSPSPRRGGCRPGALAQAGAWRQMRSLPWPDRFCIPVSRRFFRAGGVPAGDGRRLWTCYDGDGGRRREQWVRPPDLRRLWVEAENEFGISSESGRGGNGRGEESFVTMSHNILGVGNASKHRGLYLNAPSDVMQWETRRELICRDIRNFDADIVCLQEVDRYNDILRYLKREGYAGTYKQRTGGCSDGCAIFWRENIFHLLEERSIEFKSFGLRDNVAQLCIFEMHKANSRRLLVGNVHVLFNPNRGDVKLGQIRILLQNAHDLAEKQGNIPIIIAGDFNSTPQSAVYDFMSTSQLKLTLHGREHLSEQNMPNLPQSSLPRFFNHLWTDVELKTATGSCGCTQLSHPFKLQSAYASVKGTQRTRGPRGEPLATTYHSKFLGTVDYLWYSDGLSPTRVLDTLPNYILMKTSGLPCDKIGSDHLALASEFVFKEESKKKITRSHGGIISSSLNCNQS